MKKITRKRIAAIMLVLSMCVQVYPMPLLAETEQSISVAAEAPMEAATFRYASGSKVDYEGTCYYSDSYFAQPSCGSEALDGYNASLATASLCLAQSASGSNDGGSNDYSNKFKNAEDLLKKLNFEEDQFAKNEWFTKKPQNDSIGVAASNKKLHVNGEDYTLIAVAVRGGGYESEWVGNFTLGSSGQHFGFAKAKSQVLDFLKGYIDEKQISGNIKIWITGYSRAAATANLTAGAINDGESLGSSVTIKKEDLYAYCFATPMGVQKSEIKNRLDYNNIYNIINKNDPVTKVAMSALNFTRFGSDYFLPDNITDGQGYEAKKLLMLEFYNQLNSCSEAGTYIVDDFQMKTIKLAYLLPGGKSPVQDDPNNKANQAEYLDTTINKLTKENIKTRANYVKEFQNGIRIILQTLYGTILPDQPAERILEFSDIFTEKISSADALERMTVAIFSLNSSKNLNSVINDILEESLNEAGLNNYQLSSMAEFVGAISRLVISFAVKHPILTITGISNVESLGAAHYPELCMAWLMSQDKNYTSNVLDANGSGNYRIIRINCPVNVEVYDENKQLKAAIIDNIPQAMPDSTIVSSMNEDGEKLVYLPANADYDVQITATGDGEMNYAINEYSSSVGDITRILNYQNLVIQNGDILNAEIPAYRQEEMTNNIENSSTAYTLNDAEGRLLTADQELTGEAAQGAFYMVEVQANYEERGIVNGQGIRQEGHFAKVEAVAQEGFQFTGWYVGDTLVSEEPEYRLCIERDITLVAHFNEDLGTSDNGYEGGNAQDKRGRSISVRSDVNSISKEQPKKSSNENKTITEQKGNAPIDTWFIIIGIAVFALWMIIIKKKCNKQ